MMSSKTARAAKILGLAAALILPGILISCMKAGDGLGLTAAGTPRVVDPCVANPLDPGCVVTVDTCLADPARCLDCTTLPKPVECLDREYFTANVLPIFKAKCVSCHVKPDGPGFQLGKLTLEASYAWDSVVNVRSYEMFLNKKITMMRVSPGQPDSSYLYQKITKPTPAVGSRMPPGITMTDADILVFKTWITGRN